MDSHSVETAVVNHTLLFLIHFRAQDAFWFYPLLALRLPLYAVGHSLERWPIIFYEIMLVESSIHLHLSRPLIAP